MTMLTAPRALETVECLQSLLNQTFRMRDLLYAASEAVHDGDQVRILKWLGDRIGGHAATLEQIILANGEYPVDPDSSESFEVDLQAASRGGGDHEVLNLAELAEYSMLTEYDSAIDRTHDVEIKDLLYWQRGESEFADCVLRSLMRVSV
jgi:hypothetical protein